MSDIAKGVGNLFASVVEIIKGIFATIFNVFQGALNAVIGLFKSVFGLFEGVLGFIIGMSFSHASRELKSHTDAGQETSSSLGLWLRCTSGTFCTSNARERTQLQSQERQRTSEAADRKGNRAERKAQESKPRLLIRRK